MARCNSEQDGFLCSIDCVQRESRNQEPAYHLARTGTKEKEADVNHNVLA